MIRLVNISKARALALEVNDPIVSISDIYDTSPLDLPHKDTRPFLRVEFFPGDYIESISAENKMTDAKAKSIVDFVIAQRDTGAEVIYFQCGEGRIRSYTCCDVLAMIDGFTHDHGSSCIKQGILDIHTARILSKQTELIES